MGLKVTTLACLPIESDRDYFFYLLDYGWTSELSEAMYANFERFAYGLSRAKGVVAEGLNRREFADEVFSWHRVNGESAEDLLPAILAMQIHPAEFASHNQEGSWRKGLDGCHRYDNSLLIPIRKICSQPDDVPRLLEALLKHVRDGDPIAEFDVERRMNGPANLADIVIAQPTAFGFGIDLKELARGVPSFLSKRKGGR